MKKLLVVIDYQNDFVNGALGFAGAELLLQILGVDIVQHVFNRGNAHFYTGVALPQQFDGILFNHICTSLC